MATTTTETTEHAAKTGMPQLDTTTWTPQLVWLAITFIALYIVISKVAVPGIGGVMATRRKTISDDLAQAQKLKGETDGAIKAYEAALAEARAKSNAIAQDNRNRLQAETDAQRAAIDADLAGKAARAESAIAAAKARALGGIDAMAADLASDIIAHLTGGKATTADVAKAVKAAG